MCEFVFVFARDKEQLTFNTNKQVSSISRTNQNFYKPFYNIIEAKNNDGSNKLNKATFSSDFAFKLLSLYCDKDSVVFDPFMGTGSTGVACSKYGCSCIGSEISEKQYEYSLDRINKIELKLDF